MVLSLDAKDRLPYLKYVLISHDTLPSLSVTALFLLENGKKRQTEYRRNRLDVHRLRCLLTTFLCH